MTRSAKWWTLTMTSVTPKACRREKVISRRVRPESSTSALGRLSVSGRRRVPRPAARIMAFIGGCSAKKLKPKGDSSHPQADPFVLQNHSGRQKRAGAKRKEKVGQLRSE